MDIHHHTAAVDIGDLQVERLLEPQAAGIDGREVHEVMKRRDVGEDFVNGFFRRYFGKPFFFLCFENREKIPVGDENKLVVESDPVITEIG